jgi:membrane protein DedA with SNARE-associated domain
VSSALAVLLHYRYAALFGYVLASQCGVPVPVAPMLLVAGALVADGRLVPTPTLATVVLACLIANSAWFQLGRARGNTVIRLLCRISLEPAVCMRSARDAIARHGLKFLLVAKFVPGVGLMAAPSAGHSKMPYPRFAAFEVAGATGWAGAYLLLGGLIGRELAAREGVLSLSARLVAAVVLVSAMALVAYRLVRLRRARRHLARVRITPAELNRRMQSGHPPRIVDLRGRGDLDEDHLSLPGAVQLTAGELLARIGEVPVDDDLVLVCDCPGDVASSEAAWKLQRMGFDRARPLEGGLRAWRRAGLPLVDAFDDSSSSPLTGGARCESGARD